MQQFSKYKSPRVPGVVIAEMLKRIWGAFLLFSCPVLTSAGSCSDCTNPSRWHWGGTAQKLTALDITRLLKKSHSLLFPPGLFSSELCCLVQQIPALLPRTDWFSRFILHIMMEKEGEGAKSLLSYPIPYTLILDAFSKGCSNFPNWMYPQIKPGLGLFGGF